MLKAIGSALFVTQNEPHYGEQDRGVSPGGVLDQFSWKIAQRLLDDRHPQIFELIFGSEIEIQTDCYLFITGAKYKTIRLDDEEISMNTVFKASAGSMLSFEEKLGGFRTYLFVTSIDSTDPRVLGRTRGKYNEVFRWRSQDGAVRFLPGPEASYLSDERILEGRWKIGTASNEMGLRLERGLERGGIDFGEVPTDLISKPVADGTVQLTPTGPIILLRNRQTIGGYPRIANIIRADLDLLAQYGAGDEVHLRSVDLISAREASQLKEECHRSLINSEHVA